MAIRLQGLENRHEIGISRLPQCSKACTVSRSLLSFLTAIAACSPSWHRHLRRARARARRRIQKTKYKPGCFPVHQVASDLELLENHHSVPRYLSIRRMTWWQDNSWKGAWKTGKGQGTGGKGGRGKANKKKDQKEDQGKAENPRKNAFPSYDSMPVDQDKASGSASSSASAGGSGELMQRAMKSLLELNPSLKIPKEMESALTGFTETLTTTAKDAIYEEQKMINQRRKAAAKVERLTNALTKKGLQMTAYKDHIKQQLVIEMERFEKERAQIEEDLVKAKQHLHKLESGEKVEEEMEDPYIDPSGDTLLQLLGVQETESAEIAKLKHEKMRAEQMAMHLQGQLQAIMEAPEGERLSKGPLAANQHWSMKRDSPQLPQGIKGMPDFKKQRKGMAVVEVKDSPTIATEMEQLDG